MTIEICFRNCQTDFINEIGHGYKFRYNVTIGVCAYKKNYKSREHVFERTRGEGGGGCHSFPSEVFLSFFQDDKTSARDVVSSCLFTPRVHFETILVMVSYYRYEI